MFGDQFADIDEISRTAWQAELLLLLRHGRFLFGCGIDPGHRLEQDDVEVGAIFVEEQLGRWQATRGGNFIGLCETADEFFLFAGGELENLEPRFRPGRGGRASDAIRSSNG